MPYLLSYKDLQIVPNFDGLQMILAKILHKEAFDKVKSCIVIKNLEFHNS